MVLCSRYVFHAPLRFLPLHGLIVVRAPWLDWTPPLLRHLGEYHDRIALHGGGGGGGGGGGLGGCYDLSGSVVSPVDAAFVW